MTRRMIGRRLVGDPKEALRVVVYRRWWQPNDIYFNEGQIGVNINAGVLTIEMPDEITSYEPRSWRRVVSTHLNKPGVPGLPKPPHQH